jgi:hypothetical protein
MMVVAAQQSCNDSDWGEERGITMSEVWNTKYGKRRVRNEPATLEDAVFAAQGMTDDLEGQIEIACSLIDLPRDTVKAALTKKAPLRLNTSRIASTAANGQTRAVIVERRPVRRMVGGPLRSGTA